MSQFDHKVRVVSLPNLRAMCARVSGTCHRFDVCGPMRHLFPVTGSFPAVRVEYSNPNEYGTEYPIIAVFPVVYIYGPDSPAVILDIADILDEYGNSIPDDTDGIAEYEDRGRFADPDTGFPSIYPYDPAQCFAPILDCPQLFRSGPDTSDWQTEAECDEQKERTA